MAFFDRDSGEWRIGDLLLGDLYRDTFSLSRACFKIEELRLRAFSLKGVFSSETVFGKISPRLPVGDQLLGCIRSWLHHRVKSSSLHGGGWNTTCERTYSTVVRSHLRHRQLKLLRPITSNGLGHFHPSGEIDLQKRKATA